MQKLTITVTEDDISKGLKANCYICPVALAMQRVLGQPVNVKYTFAYIPSGMDCTFYRLDQAATDFINAFDGDNPVAPFTFVATEMQRN